MRPSRDGAVPGSSGLAVDLLPLADPATSRAAFAQSVIRGLGDHPRWLSCRYLYDARGSALFERITTLPEYYPTRTEAALLAAHAPRIRAVTGQAALVELGAGSATKTRHLLRAWTAAGATTYVPIDISREHLAAACADLRTAFPEVTVRGVAGTYEQALARLRQWSPCCLVFLGSSLGNLNPDETDEFLERVEAGLSPGDHFLLGIDLVKDVRTLEAAYDDPAGVTAAFTRNLFVRMNRELGTRLDVDAIRHVAYWNAALQRIEIWARFEREQVVALPEYDRTFRLAAGEMVLVEISRKFDPLAIATVAARHGLRTLETFTDAARAFALLLLRRQGAAAPAAWRRRVRHDLETVRARTLALVAPLADGQLRRQHSPLLSPIVWDLGHVANYEEQWVCRAVARGARLDPDAAHNDGLYDPIRHPRARRAELSLLDRAGALDFLARVRAHTGAVAARLDGAGDPLVRDGYVLSMIAQHEAQHAETMLQAIQLVPDLVYEPAWREEPPARGRPLPPEVIVPAGPFVMGTDDAAEAYDNERPAHVVTLPRYRIDTAPVTNAQFLAFMEDGGYRRRDCWSAAGWAWLAEARVAHPAQWRVDPADGWCERTFGRLVPLVPDRPVMHVSWYEADAYARWAGKRLPTEAEWEKAAAWDLERGLPRRHPWGDGPPTPERATLGARTGAPAAVGAHPRGASYFGCEQMLGCVWEWTASDFAPYPGFVAFPYAQYSAVHFGCGYKVLRGGSWATQPVAIRTTFRNWDWPQRRQIFAGFRCARDG